jgi:hypothetical protein
MTLTGEHDPGGPINSEGTDLPISDHPYKRAGAASCGGLGTAVAVGASTLTMLPVFDAARPHG